MTQTFSWGGQITLSNALLAIAYSLGNYAPTVANEKQIFTIEIDNTANPVPVKIYLEKEANADTSPETIVETVLAGQCKFIGGLNWDNLSYLKGQVTTGTANIQLSVWSGYAGGSGGLVNPNNPYVTPTRTRSLTFTLMNQTGSGSLGASITNSPIFTISTAPTFTQSGNGGFQMSSSYNYYYMVGYISVSAYTGTVTFALIDNGTSVATYTIAGTGNVYFVLAVANGHTLAVWCTTGASSSVTYSYSYNYTATPGIPSNDTGYNQMSISMHILGYAAGTAVLPLVWNMGYPAVQFTALLIPSLVPTLAASTMSTVIDTSSYCCGVTLTGAIPFTYIGIGNSAIQPIIITETWIEALPG